MRLFRIMRVRLRRSNSISTPARMSTSPFCNWLDPFAKAPLRAANPVTLSRPANDAVRTALKRAGFSDVLSPEDARNFGCTRLMAANILTVDDSASIRLTTNVGIIF